MPLSGLVAAKPVSVAVVVVMGFFLLGYYSLRILPPFVVVNPRRGESYLNQTRTCSPFSVKLASP